MTNGTMTSWSDEWQRRDEDQRGWRGAHSPSSMLVWFSLSYISKWLGLRLSSHYMQRWKQWILFIFIFNCNHDYPQVNGVSSTNILPLFIHHPYEYKQYSLLPLELFCFVNWSLIHSFKTIVGELIFFFFFLLIVKNKTGITGAC